MLAIWYCDAQEANSQQGLTPVLASREAVGASGSCCMRGVWGIAVSVGAWAW